MVSSAKSPRQWPAARLDLGTTDTNMPLIEFTPFIDALNADVLVALRGLFGIPESVSVSWYDWSDDDGRWRLSLVIGTGEEITRFHLARPRELSDPWFRGTRFEIRHVLAPEEEKPPAKLFEKLWKRLAAQDRAGDRGGFATLERAVEAQRPFQGLTDYIFRTSSPREALIRLGFRCNQKCSFCWQDRQWPEPPSELYAVWIEEIIAGQRRELCISGGEPTLRQDLPALIRKAREGGLFVRVQSNVIRFANAGYAEDLVDAGLGGLFISYHSNRPDVSDAMTRAPKTHRLTEIGITRALELGVEVHLNCVVDRRNTDHLAEHAQHVVETFVAPFPSNPVRRVQYSHPCSYYDEESYTETIVPFDEVRSQLIAAVNILVHADVEAAAIGTCGFPPCVLGDIPRVSQPMYRAEEAESDTMSRTFGPLCSACAVKPVCLGIRHEYFEIFGDRGIKPFDAPPPWAKTEGPSRGGSSDGNAR